MSGTGNSLAAGLRASRDWSSGAMDVEGFARLDLLGGLGFVELTGDREGLEGIAGLQLHW